MILAIRSAPSMEAITDVEFSYGVEISCGFRFLFRLAETRKAAPVARDLTWPSTADDGELLQFFSF